MGNFIKGKGFQKWKPFFILHFLKENLNYFLNCGMSKTELRDALKAKGIFDKTGTRDPLWDSAFRLYHQETRRKLSQSCGSCYNTLRNWLNS